MIVEILITPSLGALATEKGLYDLPETSLLGRVKMACWPARHLGNLGAEKIKE